MTDVAPVCCGVQARLTTGAEIYPHRPDLHKKPIYKCDVCGGYCGCHPGTKRTLGTPATAKLRRARRLLHEQFIDPIWKYATVPPDTNKTPKKYRKIARSRVYSFIALRLNIERSACHTGMFSLEQCRAAARALKGLTYRDIAKAVAAEKSSAKDEPSASPDDKFSTDVTSTRRPA